jgi:DNA-directed RNA polymerase specialized sigma subunit
MENRNFDKALPKYEAFIRRKARTYAWIEADRPDLEQAGRIALWQTIETYPGQLDSYYRQAVQNAMIDVTRSKNFRERNSEPSTEELPPGLGWLEE